MELSYNFFVKCLIDGDQRIFNYEKNILIIENTGKVSHFYVELNGIRIIEQSYSSPQLLLENARVDGKSLQEIWEELTLD